MLVLFLIFPLCAAAPHSPGQGDGRLSKSLHSISFPQNGTEVCAELDVDDECTCCTDILVPVVYHSMGVFLATEFLDLMDGDFISASECVEFAEGCDTSCGGWINLCPILCPIYEAICAAAVAAESILGLPMEVFVMNYLMENYPPQSVCEDYGYCSPPGTN